MRSVALGSIAHTRSGDKGDVANIGVIAWKDAGYPVILREVTAERVKRFFGDWVGGPVERYALANLGALNFVMREALDGGGTLSLRLDAQGKTLGAALLRLEIEVTDDEFANLTDGPGGAGNDGPGGEAERAGRSGLRGVDHSD